MNRKQKYCISFLHPFPYHRFNNGKVIRVIAIHLHLQTLMLLKFLTADKLSVLRGNISFRPEFIISFLVP